MLLDLVCNFFFSCKAPINESRSILKSFFVMIKDLSEIKVKQHPLVSVLHIFYVCPASLISSFSLFQHSPWKYFPLSQPVLWGTLRNVAGEEGWEGLAWSKVVKTLRLIFPSWLEIAYLLIAYGGQGRRGEGEGWGLLKHGVASVDSGRRGSVTLLTFQVCMHVS